MKIVRPLFQSKITNVEVSGIEYQLKRIADALESLLPKVPIVPERDFDVDDFSSVSYIDEGQELIDQHLAKRVGGFVVDDIDGPGLY